MVRLIARYFTHNEYRNERVFASIPFHRMRLLKNAGFLTKAAVKAVLIPSRWRLIFDKNAWKFLRLKLKGVTNAFAAQSWGTKGKVVRRQYASYDAYLFHQRSKLDILNSGGKFGVDGTDLGRYDAEFRQVLAARIKDYLPVGSTPNVVCLGARLGTEVKAFIDNGCFAIGIDLNPGKESSYVLTGDFHKTIFAGNSVDVAFSNSLDHSFALPELFTEISRILKPGGKFIAEIQLGELEGDRANTGQWESLAWERVEDIERLLVKANFSIVHKSTFEAPWPGKTLIAEKNIESAISQ